MNNDILIAEFMGWEQGRYPHLPNFLHQGIGPFEKHLYVGQLAYDELWEWLMPVVDKIESMGYDTAICSIVVKGEKLTEVLISPQEKEGKVEFHYRDPAGKIQLTYRAVVDFITWYNLQKP